MYEENKPVKHIYKVTTPQSQTKKNIKKAEGTENKLSSKFIKDQTLNSTIQKKQMNEVRNTRPGQRSQKRE